MNRRRCSHIFLYVCVVAIIAFALAIVMVIVCNVLVKQSAKNRLYSDVTEIPYRKVGLVLGTTPKRANGGGNLYYDYRIEAAAELYFACKISRILVSGDNHRLGYNEPEDMRQSLIEKGVPDSVIVLDYAGFRTLDSMVRAKKVFGQDSVTVVSQFWHNERAVYLAKTQDLDAIAFNAKDVNYPTVYLKNHLRELLAKMKAVMDVIFNKSPKFLGEPIVIS